MISNLLIVGFGGFLGAISRYAVTLWIGQKWATIFPIGTFVVNVSGSFLVSFFMSLFTEKLMVSPQLRMFLIIGFLGAYTTFSTFEYETGTLVDDSEWLLALANIILSVIAGFIALKCGEFIAKSI